jgi:hypothetical protein
MAGFKEAYAQAGYSLGNPRNDWSAVKDDGKGVALTVWQDEIVKGQGELHLDLRNHPHLCEWKDRQGNRKRIADIRHGLSQCDGRFDIILCRAVDVNASPRKVASAEHWKRLVGVIQRENFEEVNGTFLITFVPA